MTKPPYDIYDDDFPEKIREKSQRQEKPKKKFVIPWKAKSGIRKANRQPEFVFVQYLTQKGTIEFRVERIVSGNIVVIRNKAHVINPKRTWRQGKNLWYILREIDRYPVSNEDYDEIKLKGHDTEADVPLIKAVLAAQQKPSPLQNKNIWIILIIVAIAIFALWKFMPQ